MNQYPSELAPLLVALGWAGIELAAHGDRLRHRPADLPTDLLARLRLHRGAVLGLLLNEYTPSAYASDGEAGYVFGERLGVADGLGMPTHSGSAAWLIAVGESIEISCRSATLGVPSGHGTTNEGHGGGGAGERTNALRHRQGCQGGPQSTVASDEWRARAKHGHDRAAGGLPRTTNHDRTEEQDHERTVKHGKHRM